MKNATPPSEERDPSHGYVTSTAGPCLRQLKHPHLRPADSITAHRAVSITALAPWLNERPKPSLSLHTRLLRLNDEQDLSYRLAPHYLSTAQQLNQE